MRLATSIASDTLPQVTVAKEVPTAAVGAVLVCVWAEGE
jgi:hypothetical protein